MSVYEYYPPVVLVETCETLEARVKALEAALETFVEAKDYFMLADWGDRSAEKALRLCEDGERVLYPDRVVKSW